MSELPSHGTGWSETETLMDVVMIYNGDENIINGVPDFGTVQRRLREKFTNAELHAFDAIVTVLLQFVKLEITQRKLGNQESAEAPTSER